MDPVTLATIILVAGIVLCIAAGFIALTLIGDLLYVMVNPRLRYT